MNRLSRIALLLLALLLLPVRPTAEEAEALSRPNIVSAAADGAVVRVEADREIAAYCITAIDVVPEPASVEWRPAAGTGFSAFKSDGTYSVRVRDAAGEVSDAAVVTVASGFSVPIEAQGIKPLKEPIEKALEKNGDSIEEFNLVLAESALSAGLYTRAGVANVCMALLDRLAGYGLTLHYQPSGNYTREHDWGMSENWGKKMRSTESDAAGTYNRYGMNCGTIIAWAYKQAGLNLVGEKKRGYYDYGIRQKYDDNKTGLDNGDTGDIIATKTGHTILILDRVDTDADGATDSYLVFEMESPYLKLKLRSFYSIRRCTLYDMGALFDDTGVRRKTARFWPGSFYIPESAFPAYYAEAKQRLMDRGEPEEALLTFSRRLLGQGTFSRTLKPVKLP